MKYKCTLSFESTDAEILMKALMVDKEKNDEVTIIYSIQPQIKHNEFINDVKNRLENNKKINNTENELNCLIINIQSNDLKMFMRAIKYANLRVSLAIDTLNLTNEF